MVNSKILQLLSRTFLPKNLLREEEQEEEKKQEEEEEEEQKIENLHS